MTQLESLVHLICQQMGIDEEDIRLRKTYLGLTGDEEALLHQVHGDLARFRERFLDELYEGFLAFPPTAALLRDEAQIQRLKASQASYFDDLTCGEYGPDYVHHRLRVGVAHQRAGLESKWYLAAYSQYLVALLRHLGEVYEGDKAGYLRLAAALIKVIFLDIGLAMDAYFHAGRMNEAALKAYSESLVDNAPCGMLVLSSELRVLSANPSARRLLQLCDEVRGLTLESLFPGEEIRELALSAQEEGHASYNMFLPFAGGETRNLLLTFTRLPLIEDGSGRPLSAGRLLLTLEDFTSLWRARTEVSRISNYDELTGLPNRKLFLELAGHALARARGKPGRLAVLFLDLNRFKNINDTLGHEAGDALLRELALRLKHILRNNDIVSHFGADHFTILLQGIYDRQDCMHAVQKIMNLFATPFRIGEREVFLSANIGISFFPDDASEPQELLKYADAALHQCKNEGRGDYCCFREGMDQGARRALSLETELRRALERRQFCLYYQPIVGLEDSRVLSFEALLRWYKPDGEMVPPLQFLPMLEETGLIREAGDWILEEACAMARQWEQADGPAPAVSVNVSSLQLTDPHFARRVFHILSACDLPPEKLELELTESMLVEQSGVTAENLETLAEMGVRLAIDDFGIGYSSLSYLHRFPLHTLKIDRSFIQDICEAGQSAAVARTIVTLGQALQLRAVAEGVETYAQLQMLKAWGCTAIQGYLLSRPVERRHVKALLERDWSAACTPAVPLASG